MLGITGEFEEDARLGEDERCQAVGLGGPVRFDGPSDGFELAVVGDRGVILPAPTRGDERGEVHLERAPAVRRAADRDPLDLVEQSGQRRGHGQVDLEELAGHQCERVAGEVLARRCSQGSVQPARVHGEQLRPVRFGQRHHGRPVLAVDGVGECPLQCLRFGAASRHVEPSGQGCPDWSAGAVLNNYLA